MQIGENVKNIDNVISESRKSKEKKAQSQKIRLCIDRYLRDPWTDFSPKSRNCVI